jgi:acyl carrier protein phosphodiesterase
MNFLGHIYLSGNNDDIMLGNFCGDFLKGKSYLKYPEPFQKGVMIHRAIDSYTDTHDAVKKLKLLFSEKYQKYAGIIVDVVFDHFLSQTWQIFSKQTLTEFVEDVHEVLDSRKEELPAKAQKLIPSFIQKKWIETYTTIPGLELVFSRMSVRTSLPPYSGFAIKQITNNYDLILDEFVKFFFDIMKYISRNYGIVYELPNTTISEFRNAKA